MFFEVFEVEFLGGLMTFDVVTAYGLLCAAVFLTGFFVATHYESSRNARVRAQQAIQQQK